MNPLSLLAPGVAIGRDWLAARSKRKQAKLDTELRLNEAKTEAMIQRMQTQQAADISWENLSIQNNGWRDEWFTLLLSVPVVLCFIPGGDVYVQAGFEALDTSTPDWFQYSFLVAVASSFGYRKLADFMKLRNGA